MSTPERQQDPGEHGYGGVQPDKKDVGQEHPLDDPKADPRRPEDDDSEHQDDKEVEG